MVLGMRNLCVVVGCAFGLGVGKVGGGMGDILVLGTRGFGG